LTEDEIWMEEYRVGTRVMPGIYWRENFGPAQRLKRI
jgi:hypothetical protein